MPRYVYTWFLSVVLVANLVGQPEWYHYDWKKNGMPDKLEWYTKTLNADLAKYKRSEYLGMYDMRFISGCALGTYQNIECGNLYESFDGYEVYVRKVLEATIGDIQLCKQIKILFLRDADFNASMSENGVLTLNVGLLPQLRNEAELALILAHEIGHYLNEDVVRNYGRYMAAAHHSGGSGVLGMINGIRSANDYFAFSRGIESNADINAMRFLDASSYSFPNALGAYKTMEALQTRYQLKEGKILGKWRTHPYAGERLTYLSELSSKRSLSGTKNYVVDSTTFSRFREVCFQQCVNICLADCDLDELMLLTFSRYLFEPENEANLAILIEAIRRKLNYAPEDHIGDKQFILNEYLSPLTYKYEEFVYLRNPSLSILQCLNRGLLNLRPDEVSLIKALDLKDTSVIEFKTYLEAYVYFKERAAARGNKLANHYQFFGKMPDFSGAESYTAINSVFQTNSLLKEQGKVHLKDSSVIVFLPIWSSFSPLLTHNHELQEFTQINNDLRRTADSGLPLQAPHLLATEMNMDHQRVVYNLSTYAYKTAKKTKPLLGVYTSTVNWLNCYPEAYNLFSDLGIHTLYICSVSKKNDKKMEVEFYKITLPGYGKNMLELKILDMPLKLAQDLYPDFRPVSRELIYFLKYHRK